MEILYMLSCIGIVKHIAVYTDKVENNGYGKECIKSACFYMEGYSWLKKKTGKICTIYQYKYNIHTLTLACTYTYADVCFYTEKNLKYTNIISVIHGANVERGKTFVFHLFMSCLIRFLQLHVLLLELKI